MCDYPPPGSQCRPPPPKTQPPRKTKAPTPTIKETPPPRKTYPPVTQRPVPTQRPGKGNVIYLHEELIPLVMVASDRACSHGL